MTDHTLPQGAPPSEAPTLAPAAPSQSDPLALPVRVPGYEILGELGRGGMGVVYKARQARLRRLVALKMILSGAHAGEAELARFRTEAEAIARLSHPNIVQVHEVGDHDGKPYFSLEYCPGGSLEKQLDGTPRAPGGAAELVIGLAAGVQAAHAHDVVHRDLKPANVLLAEDGTPKITDFGLAKRLDDDSGATRTGAIMGTPSYMAPEQAEGKKDVGPAADIYALGAILYELLTGRPPFKAATPLDTILQVVSEEPVPPRVLNARTPRDLETVCLKCLHKDPARRYASAAALADDLGRFLRGEPVLARPVSRLERGWRWCRRNPAAAAAALLGLCVLAGAVAVPSILAVREARNAKALGEEQEKTTKALERSRENERKAQEAEKAAVRQAAESTLERAQALCEQGDTSRGLHWMARALSLAERAGDAPLGDSCRWNIGAWGREVHPLERVLAHPTRVNAARYSPDGRWIATACEGKVRLWRADGGAEPELLDHPGTVTSVAFRPDGAELVAGCADGNAYIWGLRPGKRRAVLPATSHVHVAAWSPDGAWIATGSSDGKARLWDAAKGTMSGQPLVHAKEVYAAAFSPDSRTLACSGAHNGRIHFWSVPSGKPARAPIPTNFVTHLAYHPDGNSVFASLGGIRAVIRYDVRTGREVGPRLAHLHWATGSAPTAGFTATGGEDRVARLWTADGRPLGPPIPHPGVVTSVAAHPSGERILTGCDDGGVRVWRVAWGALRHELRHDNWVLGVTFTPDGRRLLTGTERSSVRFWDVATGAADPALPDLRLDAGEGSGAFCWSPDGRFLFGVWLNGGRIYRWEPARGWARTIVGVHGDDVQWLLATPDGKTLLSGGYGWSQTPHARQVKRWAVDGSGPLAPLQHPVALTGMALVPGQGRLLTACGKETRLWDLATGTQVGETRKHDSPAGRLAVAPDGKSVVMGGAEPFVQRRELDGWRASGPPMPHRSVIAVMKYLPAGRLLITGSDDGTARLWHHDTSRPVGPPLRHSDRIIDVAVSQDGALLATCGLDRMARLWAAPTPAEGDVNHLRRWVEGLTGMEMDEAGGINDLSPAAWAARLPAPP